MNRWKAVAGCRSKLALLAVSLIVIELTGSTFADDWPQWLGPHRDSVWPETGIVAGVLNSALFDKRLI